MGLNSLKQICVKSQANQSYFKPKVTSMGLTFLEVCKFHFSGSLQLISNVMFSIVINCHGLYI